MRKINKFIFVTILVAMLMVSTLFACHKNEENVKEEPENKVLYTIDDSDDTIYYMGLYPQTISNIDPSLVKQGEKDPTTGWYKYENKLYSIAVAENILEDYNKILSDGSVVETGKEYVFLVEPIKWKKIFSPVGEALLLSEKIIDGGIYKDYTKLSVDASNDCIIEPEVYANCYERSEVRSKLLEIYNISFAHYGEAEKSNIIIKEQDNITTNGGEKTLYSERQVNTNDALFLLSYADFYNTKYKINVVNSSDLYKKYRKKIVTDYAIVKGVPSFEDQYGTWWTRSTTDRSNSSTIVRKINVLGNLSEGDISISSGIVPTIWIKS